MSEVRQLAGTRYLKRIAPRDCADQTAAAAIEQAVPAMVAAGVAVRRGERI